MVIKNDFAIILYFGIVILKPSAYTINSYGKETVSPKIVGGGDARIEDFPFMVLLEIYNGSQKWTCCGSYIKALWVLTAGHCIDFMYPFPPDDGSRQNRVICIMEKDERTQTEYQAKESTKFFLHPRYRRMINDVQNDLGLIQLQYPFEITPKAKIAKLIDREIDYSGVSAFIVGWGATKKTDLPYSITFPKKLQMLKITVHNMIDCENLTESDTTICIGKKGAISSYGDSGSPLVYDNMVIGVCSYSFAYRREAGVYENVYKHRKWIKRLAKGHRVVSCVSIMCLSIVIFILRLRFCQLSALF